MAKKRTVIAESEELTAQAEAVETILVRSTLKSKTDGGETVALFERDAAHPGGEAYVAGSDPVEVGITPRVSQLLREGTLEEVAGDTEE